MNPQEIKRRVLEAIQRPIEWPKDNQGTDRMALLQVAFDQGWYIEELQ